MRSVGLGSSAWAYVWPSSLVCRPGRWSSRSGTSSGADARSLLAPEVAGLASAGRHRRGLRRRWLRPTSPRRTTRTTSARSRAREKTAAQELPQHPLDHRPQRPVAPREAKGPDAPQLIELALDELIQRRLVRPPRLIDPASDLHAQPEAVGNLRCSGLPTTGECGCSTGRASSGSRRPQGKDVRLSRRTADLRGAACSNCRLQTVPQLSLFSVRIGPKSSESAHGQGALRSSSSCSGSAGSIRRILGSNPT
jgi:hypothetical protein